MLKTATAAGIAALLLASTAACTQTAQQARTQTQTTQGRSQTAQTTATPTATQMAATQTCPADQVAAGLQEVLPAAGGPMGAGQQGTDALSAREAPISPDLFSREGRTEATQTPRRSRRPR